MLKADIGTPQTSLKNLSYNLNRKFMTYQTRTKVPLSDYTVIGNTTSTRLYHPELSPQGYLDVVPSLVYYLQRGSSHPSIPTTPVSCVLAREYTKGLVIYRTNVYGGGDLYGGSAKFLLTNVTVQLPVIPGFFYRRVLFNGSLSGPVHSVTIGGYEGMVFVSVPSTSAQSSSPRMYPSAGPTLSSTLAPSFATTVSPSGLPSQSPISSMFKLAWYYDFSTELSWDFNIYAGPFGSSSNTLFQKSNAKVFKNQLSLTINNASTSTSRPYASGGIGSWAPHSQIYGRWEVSARFPPGYGVTGYIGLFPTDKSWPPEVDFAEVIGRQSSLLYLTQHYGANWTVHKQTGKTFSTVSGANAVDWTQTFHVFAIEWTPQSLVYFVGGVPVYVQTTLFKPTPMDIAIGTGVGDCGSWVDCPNNAAKNLKPYPLPSTMYVNYIKKYSYSPNPSSAPSPSSSQSPSNAPTSLRPTTQQPSVPYSLVPSKLPTIPPTVASINVPIAPSAMPTSSPSDLIHSPIFPSALLPSNSPTSTSTSKSTTNSLSQQRQVFPSTATAWYEYNYYYKSMKRY